MKLKTGKKLMAFLLGGSLLLGSLGVSAAPEHWAEEAFAWAESRGISAELWSEPGHAVTRGELSEILYQSAGSPQSGASARFSDITAETPYARAIGWAAGEKIINGYEDQTFRPDRQVSREEFMTMLYRREGSLPVSGIGLAHFGDRREISSWAWDAALWSVNAGLAVGDQNGNISPQNSVTAAETLTVLMRAENLPDISAMANDLKTLTTQPRPIGSEGERNAADYLIRRFTEMGYQVSTQDYTDENGKTGRNVIAVKPAKQANGDILVISAHHDSVPTAYGANDDASGVTALLRIAESLKDVEGDTEIRLISFTDEENGKNGSRFYTDGLTEEEKSGIIGDIQLDMLGGLGSDGLLVCTTDGEPNWLSDALREQDSALALDAETASDHAAFQLEGIPSVLLMQNGQGYLYHSAADTADNIDLYAVERAASLAAGTAQQILAADTPSFRETARREGDNYTYVQTRQNVIYFDSSLADTEAYIGAKGELVNTETVQGDGWADEYTTYRYAMRWFGAEQAMNTYYKYRNGFLSSIEIRPAENGYTAEQTEVLIRGMYGEPDRSETGEDGSASLVWNDEVYGKSVGLNRKNDGFTVSVGNYWQGITNVLASYPVTDGQAEINSPQDKKVWDYLCSFLPAEARGLISSFQLYTDGTSNVLAYASPAEAADGSKDNSSFVISIDYYDVYDENGQPRDWSKLTYTILHEFGHALLENNTQIDLSLAGTTHDPAGFIEGSFRKRFYDRFWKDVGDTGVTDYETNPTSYVSRYGANYFHEDIADCFAVFVLGGKPDGNSVAQQKLFMFYEEPAFVRLRAEIRQNLGMDSAAE